MRVGRKGALVLLAVAVLWTAMPALASLTSAAEAACCRGMARNCCSRAMVMHHTCCEVHAPEQAVPPGSASTPDQTVQFAQLPIRAEAPAPPVLTGATLFAAGASPSASPPGINSILRI